MGDELDPFNEGMEGKGKYYPMVVLTNKKLLMDDTYADLIIKVGNESVQAHAAVVCCRCTEIVTIQDEKLKKTKKKIEVKIKEGNVASAAIMNKVLEFLYTGMVDFPKITDKELLHLTVASRFFKLGRLSYLCERWMKEHMTIESVFNLLRAASDLNEQRIKGYCLQFALQHYNEFISNKDGIYILGIELFQEIVAAFQTNPAPPEDMKGAENPDTLLQDFRRLYDQMPFSDGSIVIGGETIRFHRAVLQAHSDSLGQAINKDDGTIRVSPKAFKSMLKFSYYGEDDIEPLPSCELVDFSRKFKLHTLLRICEDKIRNSVALDTAVAILAVSYLPSDGKQDLVDELRGKCFPFILQNISKIDLSLIKTLNPLLTIDLLLELQNSWKKGDYGLGKNIGSFGSAQASIPQSAYQPPVAHNPPPSFNQQPNSFQPAVNAGNLSARNGPSSLAPQPPSRKDGGSLLGAQRTHSAVNRPAPPPRAPQRNQPEPPPRNVDAPPSLNVPPPVSHPREATDSADGPKLNKKEEEKRKKDEAKRIQKEKKERTKMEKKFSKSKEIF